MSTKFHPIPGVRIGVAAARIKATDRPDLMVMELAEGASCAAVFTQNSFCAAPVVIAKRNIGLMTPRALIVNSGNANAGTGQNGMIAAEEVCNALSTQLDLPTNAVLPFSTGVIGEDLPTGKITAAISELCSDLDESRWPEAARAIMTTDTKPKLVSRIFKLGESKFRITGIAKGAGMIQPNMATMLSFVATDAQIGAKDLQAVLESAVSESFNCISVDGDTSTNDACVLVATGSNADCIIDSVDSQLFKGFSTAVKEVLVELAQLIVRDGEGASKFITIEVVNGKSLEECRQVAFTIANSPLVKTAFFASDPNWGRILAAVGRSGVDNLDISFVDIHLGDVSIVRAGARDAKYSESAGMEVMSQSDITITVSLGRGNQSAEIWTTDLSHEYVRINAEYRT